jgi:hypothetical protein
VCQVRARADGRNEPCRVRPYLRLDDPPTAGQDTIEQIRRDAAQAVIGYAQWLRDESWSPTTDIGTMDKRDDATARPSVLTPLFMLGLIEATLRIHYAAVGITVAATVLAGVFVSVANDRPESASPGRLVDPLTVMSDDPA